MIEQSKVFINSISKMQKKAFAFTSVLVSLLYYLYFIKFGIDLTDSFFHINNFIHKVLDPTTFFSSVMGHFSYRIFGENLISFRLTFVVLIFIMQLMPFLLIEKEKIVAYLILFFPFSLIFAPTMANYLSYDTFSIFFTTLYICLLINYIKNKNSFKIVLLSIVTAILIGVRLPNLVALFFTSFILLLLPYTCVKSKIYILGSYFFLSILFYFLIIFVCFGNFNNYFSDFQYYLSLRGKSHGLVYMLKGYIYDFLKICFFCFISFIFLLKKYLPIANPKYRKIISTIIFVTLFFWFIFEKSHAYRLGIFLNALMIGVSLLGLDKKMSLTNKLIYLSLFLFSFIPALGSDTGLHKTSFIFVFMPFVLSIYEVKRKYNIVLLLILIIPFTIFQRINSTYNDVSTTNANSKTTIQKLKYIYSSTERVNDIESVKKDFNRFTKLKKEVVFYGVKSHIFNYLFINKQAHFMGYFQLLDEDPEICKLNQLLDKNNVVLIVYNNSEATLKTNFSKSVIAKNYKFMNRNSYTIFYK
jgi:hypothetical protein